jgi:spermidine/putrescine-binding protein
MGINPSRSRLALLGQLLLAFILLAGVSVSSFGSAKQELVFLSWSAYIEPEVVARAAEFDYYAMPNKAAEQYLPAEYLEDSVTFPSGKELSRSEFHAPLEPRTQKFSNELIAT